LFPALPFDPLLPEFPLLPELPFDPLLPVFPLFPELPFDPLLPRPESVVLCPLFPALLEFPLPFDCPGAVTEGLPPEFPEPDEPPD
jgi:hypothetical protein